LQKGKKKKKRTCGVDQTLSLIFHPFLVVELHVVLVLPAGAVRLSDGGLQD
jgi:hypothetical protein